MEVDRLLQRISLMVQHFGYCDLPQVVRLCLMDLDAPTHVSGYEYLVYGVVYLYQHPEAAMSLEVYPAVAKNFGSTPADVEIAMRRVIMKAWRIQNDKWLSYFPTRRKPKNIEFFNFMVQYLRLWEMYKNQNGSG